MRDLTVTATHLESTLLFETPEEIYYRVFKALKPRTTPPKFKVRFLKFANANSFIRWKNDCIEVKITDILDGAPAPVIEALAYILLSKLFSKPAPPEYAHRYRRYLNRRDVRNRVHLVRRERGRKLVRSAKGRHYDLEQIFEELNFKYFYGLMSRPALGWSLKPSKATLGHYDPSHHTIVLSSLLDSASVPRLAVEYVLFHEMLHLRHPAEHRGARRRVHTPEFKEAEKQFERLGEARALLKLL
jgi:predicted metal-dependent hydrolase